MKCKSKNRWIVNWAGNILSKRHGLTKRISWENRKTTRRRIHYTSMNETRNWKSAWFFQLSIFLNNVFITWGISPVWQPSLFPVPMVYVLPEPVCDTLKILDASRPQILRKNPVNIWWIGELTWDECYSTWPYARTVALYPWNKPSTSGEAHSSNIADDGEPVLP